MHCLETGQIPIYDIQDLLRKSVVFACAQQLIVSLTICIKYHLDTVVIIHRMHGEYERASSE